MTGKYSPTIYWAYQHDQDWHRVASNGDLYDPDGYDSYGYNSDGVDRAGHTEWDYAQDDLYERVLHQWADKAVLKTS